LYRLALLAPLTLALVHAGPPPKDKVDFGPEVTQKARLWLDTAAGQVAAAPPEVQAGALVSIAVVETAVDKAKALEHFNQALAAGAALSTRSGARVREEFHAYLITEVAKYDLNRAVEMLQSLPETPAGERDFRAEPLNQVILALLREKQFHRAVEILNRHALAGVYPYDALTQLLKQLPPDDDRRVTLYSQALTGFEQRPNVDAYTRFLRQNLKEIPRPLLEPAVRALARTALEGRGIVNPYLMTFKNEKGVVSLDDPVAVVLFNLTDLITPFDPAFVKAASAKYPALARALEQYPNGFESLKSDGHAVVSQVTWDAKLEGAAAKQRHQTVAFETVKVQEFMKIFFKDPASALSIAREIPTARLRVRQIAMVARAAGEKDPAEAKPLLSKVIDALAEMKDEPARWPGWTAVAESAHRMNLNPAVRECQ
jgi:hypothetical protein